MYLGRHTFRRARHRHTGPWPLPAHDWGRLARAHHHPPRRLQPCTAARPPPARLGTRRCDYGGSVERMPSVSGQHAHGILRRCPAGSRIFTSRLITWTSSPDLGAWRVTAHPRRSTVYSISMPSAVQNAGTSGPWQEDVATLRTLASRPTACLPRSGSPKSCAVH